MAVSTKNYFHLVFCCQDDFYSLNATMIDLLKALSDSMELITAKTARRVRIARMEVKSRLSLIQSLDSILVYNRIVKS